MRLPLLSPLHAVSPFAISSLTIAPLCAVVAAPLAPQAAQAPVGDLVRAAIPQDALVVVHIGDLARVRAISEQNSWAALFQDEQVRPFFSAMTSELLAAAAHDLPADAPERTLLQPELWWRGLESGAFWLGGLPPDSNHYQGGFLMEFNSAGQALASSVAASLQSHLSPAPESPLNGPSSEILVWTPHAGAAPGGATTTTFRVGNVLGIHFSSTPDAAVHLAREAQNGLLAADRATREESWITRARGADWPGHGFEAAVDLERLLPALSPDKDFAEFLRVSGLDTTRYAWLGGSLCPGECLSMAAAFDLPTRGVGADVVHLFGPAPRAWLERIPADATSLSLGHFDVAGAWDLFWKVFGEQATEESAEARERYDGFTGATGFDVEADLVRQLSGDFGGFTAPVPKDELTDSATSEFKMFLPTGDVGVAWMIGLKESARVEDLLERVLERFGGAAEISSTQHAGAWYQTLSIEGIELHWSFQPDALVISLSPSLMRGMLERAQDASRPNALSNAKLMAGLQAHPHAVAISVADAAASVEQQFEALHAMAGILAFLGDGNPVADVLRGAPLPERGAASRHLKGWVSSAVEIDGRRFALRSAAR